MPKNREGRRHGRDEDVAETNAPRRREGARSIGAPGLTFASVFASLRALAARGSVDRRPATIRQTMLDACPRPCRARHRRRPQPWARRRRPVTLVEYGDYECPGCLNAQPIEGRVAGPARRPAAGRLPPLPPAAASTPGPAPPPRRPRRPAAQGRFWDMHDELFRHSQTLAEVDLTHLALKLGLDVYQFQQDTTSTGAVRPPRPGRPRRRRPQRGAEHAGVLHQRPAVRRPGRRRRIAGRAGILPLMRGTGRHFRPSGRSDVGVATVPARHACNGRSSRPECRP